MKNKGLMLGVLLIIAIFLMSPVSAAKVIDSSAKIVYSEKYDCLWKTKLEYIHVS